jgi:hypothetical protein
MDNLFDVLPAGLAKDMREFVVGHTPFAHVSSRMADLCSPAPDRRTQFPGELRRLLDRPQGPRRGPRGAPPHGHGARSNIYWPRVMGDHKYLASILPEAAVG